jgi:hypothetical protein
MTEEQLKKAAELYCSRIKCDPMEEKTDPFTGHKQTRLETIMHVMATHVLMLECIKEAFQPKDQP